MCAGLQPPAHILNQNPTDLGIPRFQLMLNGSSFHWPVPDAGLRRSLKGVLFRMADIIHLYSVETVEVMRCRYRVPAKRLQLLYSGIPPDRFVSQDTQVAREVVHARLGIPEGGRVIGYLGRLAPEKNVSYLIRFMEENASASPDLHLIVAGGGALEVALRASASSSSVSDRIHFTGYSREPERIYPAFDLLVLPSDFEAFPLVVVEAAYCGVPCLRSDVEGSRDQIVEGVTGHTYPHQRGYLGMSEALVELLERRWSDLPDMGRAARAHCLQLCDMRRFTEGLVAMYSPTPLPRR
jgi:glycosyltransferase involved in cell wall biosynthesis